MKALVYTAPLTLEMCDWGVPEPDGSDVLVEVRAAGICGSEIEGVRSRSPFRVPPLVMGHEFAGVRSDTGERVAVNPIVTCGTCDLCRIGLTEVCRSRQIIGIHRPGAFAELVCVPSASCHLLPDTVGDVQGALVEPFANAVHARALGLELSRRPVRRVGVIGGGAIGLAVATLCSDAGTVEVVVAERDTRRRELAGRASGATVADDLDGEFDVVFDAVGSAETRRASLDRLGPAGVAVWIGLHGSEAQLDGLDIVRTEKRIVGSFAYRDEEFGAAVAEVERYRPQWAETEHLSRGAEVFTDLMHAARAAPRTVLVSGSGTQIREGVH